MQLKDMAKVEAMRLFVKVLEESVQVPFDVCIGRWDFFPYPMH